MKPRLPIFAMISASTLFGADVRTFGATGNGITDDTIAIQNAINACPNQGTVTFSAGNFSVSGLVLKDQCTYAGMDRSVLTLSAPNQFIMNASEKTGIHITGLMLDGRGLGGAIIARGYMPVTSLQIDNCEFRNVPASAVYPANVAVISTYGIVNSTIQNNRFVNVAAGILVSSVQNLGILNNSFLNVTQGDAIFVGPAPTPFPNGDNLRIAGNTATNLARMGIEIFRPDPTNGSILNAPVIENNSISNWTGQGGVGLSITHGDGGIIRGNRISNTSVVTQDTAMEVIIANAQITGNVISGGFGNGIAVVGTLSPTITGNTILNVYDTGIFLACDNSRNRCTSTNSVISANTVTNARLIGIKLDNDWSNGLISRNIITRDAGFWPNDNGVEFNGIHQSPAPGRGVIDSNLIIQTATSWPAGFWFCGVHVNSSMPGSSITNNVFRSHTPGTFGTGIIDNTGKATVGWIITGNTYVNVGR